MDVDECGCNFDLDVIWKTGSKIREKQFRFFLSTFLRSLGRNCSNDTLFEAVGLMLTYTHPQPSESLIKNFKKNFKNFFLPKIQFDAIENILNALKAQKNLFPNSYRVLTTYGSHCAQ